MLLTWDVTLGLPLAGIRHHDTVHELAAGLLPLAVGVIVVGGRQAVQPRRLGEWNCDRHVER
jgi:hypothetical protein